MRHRDTAAYRIEGQDMELNQDALYALALRTWNNLTNSDKMLTHQLFLKRHSQWGDLSNDNKRTMMELVHVVLLSQSDDKK
jgi:hypothetical protein